MKISDFFKTTLTLLAAIAVVGGLGYILYNIFQEKPLDAPPPYIKEAQDADVQLVDEQEDPLFGDSNFQVQQVLPSCNATPDTQESESMLAKVNQYRAQNGLGPLKLSPNLMKAAAWFADDLLANNSSGHIDSLGRDPSQRATDCGYPVQTVGESTAGGIFMDPFEWWKNSPEHNQNFLQSKWKVMGYGIAQNGGAYRYVWMAGTQDDSATQVPPTPTNPQSTLTPTPTVPAPTVTSQISPTQASTSSPTPSPTEVLSPTSTPVISPTSPQSSITPPSGQTSHLTTQLTFPGIGASGNTNPTPSTKRILTQLLNDDNNVTRSEILTYTYNNGVYEAEWGFGNFDSLHQLRVNPDNALAKIAEPELFRIRAGEDTTVTAELVVGDLNGDNILDIRDYNSFIIKLSGCLVLPNCGELEQIDFNANGEVDAVDYNIFLRSFAEVRGI